MLVTALGVEHEAVRAHLSGIEEVVHPAGTVYEMGVFDSGPARWNVVIVETGTGNNIAAIETSRALDCFRPDVTMLVGVAGGVKDVSIGDVVAADYVYGYESSKLTDIFQPRIKTFGCGYPLVQRARAIRRSRAWIKRIADDSADHPSAFVGPIASGEQVLAAPGTPTHDLIETHCGDTLAVEMEGWGFLFAAHTNGDVPAIVVRGISDLTVGKEAAGDLANQPRAAQHASAFAFEILASLDAQNSLRISPSRPWRPTESGRA